MKIQMMVPQLCEIELKAGDKVVVDDEEIIRFIKKFVETKYNMYVVLNNGTWRPLTTYGKTWRKV